MHKYEFFNYDLEHLNLYNMLPTKMDHLHYSIILNLKNLHKLNYCLIQNTRKMYLKKIQSKISFRKEKVLNYRFAYFMCVHVLKTRRARNFCRSAARYTKVA